MEFGSLFFLIIGIVVFLVVWKGVKIVPQQKAYVIEKLGRFDRTLEPGMRILIPFIERVAYRHSLKEFPYDVMEQTAITRDNVSLLMDGLVYVRIIDPKSASYGVSEPIFAVTQLAQTTMRSEIGKLTLDQCFEERETLNANIVNSINQASQTWGIQCMRYEIKNITPPRTVLDAMELQVAAERKKRAEILDSEGTRQSKINVAEGDKQEVVLESEAAMTDQINRAKGEAEAIKEVAKATAEGIELVASAILKKGGQEAVSLKIAEQYVAAFSKLAKESNTIMLPTNAGDAGSLVAHALGVFNSIKTGGVGNAQPSPWGDTKA
jgi:regulator of protease activity HflC (stomatin/prohibitin superfamily)